MLRAQSLSPSAMFWSKPVSWTASSARGERFKANLDKIRSLQVARGAYQNDVEDQANGIAENQVPRVGPVRLCERSNLMLTFPSRFQTLHLHNAAQGVR